MNIALRLSNHPLIATLRNLQGNAKSCVLTEPLWGIPYHLYAPYMSIYMLTLGLKDRQIGSLMSIGLALQIVGALLGGAITDKLGRKRTTLIFDLLSWSIPCVLWAVAQDFNYFLAAAIFNSLWRVTSNSWVCLMVEDTPHNQLVHIYTWVYIAGLLSAFVSPITGMLINAYSLVPTVRGLFVLAFILMTAKFFILNRYVSETQRGQIRMDETRQQSFLSILHEYWGVFKQFLRTPRTLTTLGIMVVMSICMMINGTFWGILVTEKLRIPTQYIALYTFARSALMLVFFFVVMPRIGGLHFKKPMLVGFGGFVLSQLLLVSMPEKSYAILLMATLLEACSWALVNPFIDSMFIVTVDPLERARIMAIVYVVIIALTSPFGWIAGRLSEFNRSLPFVLNLGLFVIGGGLVVLAARIPAQPAQVIQNE